VPAAETRHDEPDVFISDFRSKSFLEWSEAFKAEMTSGVGFTTSG
jgi:hypothetical protein